MREPGREGFGSKGDCDGTNPVCHQEDQAPSQTAGAADGSTAQKGRAQGREVRTRFTGREDPFPVSAHLEDPEEVLA